MCRSVARVVWSIKKVSFPYVTVLQRRYVTFWYQGRSSTPPVALISFRKGSRADMHRILLEWFNVFISSLKQGTYRI